MAQKKNENYEYKGSLYNRSRQDKMTQSRPKRLRFLLPVALTIIVLATVTALLLSAFGDSKGKFDKLVKKGDYEAAWEYAESKLSGDEEVMDQIQQEMGQKVKDLEAPYVSEEATLEVTKKFT